MEPLVCQQQALKPQLRKQNPSQALIKLDRYCPIYLEFDIAFAKIAWVAQNHTTLGKCTNNSFI
jgi:hypothetical protein